MTQGDLWSAAVIVMLGYVLGFCWLYFEVKFIERRMDDLLDVANRRVADLKDFLNAKVSRLETRMEMLERSLRKP